MNAEVNESPPSTDAFGREAQAKSQGLAREFFSFLRFYRKWWLIPIILILLCVGLLLVAGGTTLAPFIYTLF